MIDAFYIVTEGGLLLWSAELVKLKWDPLDRLIKEVLAQEDYTQMEEPSCSFDEYNLRWKLLGDIDVLLVVVYQRILQIMYLECLLTMVEKEFRNLVSGTFGDGMSLKEVLFDTAFETIIKDVECARHVKMRSFADTEKGKASQKKKELRRTMPASRKTEPTLEDERRRAQKRAAAAFMAKQEESWVPPEVQAAVHSLEGTEAQAAASLILDEMAILRRTASVEVRKRKFKDFQVTWHPDKNLCQKETATQVFQFTQVVKTWFLES